MSLDVYLRTEWVENEGSGIFVRENGSIKEISWQEWNEKFPGLEPVTADSIRASDVFYTANITNNLTRMASEAGIYSHLWRPDEIGISKAEQLIDPLQAGLDLLKSDPKRFKAFNPPNGWGDYDGLVEFVENYLEACKKHQTADVSVWR